MKKFILLLILLVSVGVAQESYICKVDTKKCKESVTVLATNLLKAKIDALKYFKNSYNCNHITIKDIECKKSLEKDLELKKKDIAPLLKEEPKVMYDKGIKKKIKIGNAPMKSKIMSRKMAIGMPSPIPLPAPPPSIEVYPPSKSSFNREEYSDIEENIFKDTKISPLSTFSVDVDTASYSNLRRYLMVNNYLPPKGAIRIEELLNYFDYDYKEPTNGDPFYINTKVGKTLWNNKTEIIQIGLQTKKPDISKLPPSNLVFLLDVSGSMNYPNKLPLLKKSLKLLVKELRAKDRVSIVVYAGSSGLVLDRARGDEKEKIIKALDKLTAGGSTAGGEGIKLAYKVAKKAFIVNGNNRVILATDGDFNVGQTSESELVDLIKKRRKSGIYLTILGFGMGNYKDSKMESLADKGNGNYAYIDNLLEAKKVLVTQMSGTLYTIAKDVKIQVEFNPLKVSSYRLIGYENRKMANEDFNNDKKDAGEIGMGHRVTALYEIYLQNRNQEPKLERLKYQTSQPTKEALSNELATIKIRYKKPNGKKSLLLSKVIRLGDNDISNNDFNFAMSVAGFGMLLRDSKYKDGLSFKDIIDLAKKSKGRDEEGYRAEFIRMVEKAELLKAK